MDPNPKLIERINNRHVGKGLVGRKCLYYPYSISSELTKDIGLSVGQMVEVAGAVVGEKPKEGEIDTRIVAVAATVNKVDEETGMRKVVGITAKVFLRDLSPR